MFRNGYVFIAVWVISLLLGGAAYSQDGPRAQEKELFQRLCTSWTTFIESAQDITDIEIQESKDLRAKVQNLLKDPAAEMKKVLTASTPQDSEFTILGLCAEVLLLEVELEDAEGCEDDTSPGNVIDYQNALALCKAQTDL